MAPSKSRQRITATAETINGVREISKLTSGGVTSAQSLPELSASDRTLKSDTYKPSLDADRS